MGTSKNRIWRGYHHRDHPHAYGDKLYSCSFSSCMSGSSPRVWGQVLTCAGCVNKPGIIPTRMGTSITLCVKFCGYKDHPHAYGDKLTAEQRCRYLTGSSPRVWGQEFLAVCLSELNRIIPTRMGTRNVHKHFLSYSKDHPHAYGDKVFLPKITG